MIIQTNIRLSWYIPLPWILTNPEWLHESFKWLINKKIRKNPTELKTGYIKNFGRLSFDFRLNYPLLMKDRQNRTFNKFDFPPIFFASTPQKNVPYNINQQNTSPQETFKEPFIRNIKFDVKVYPTGFASISAYLNIDGLIDSTKSEHLLKRLVCGKKSTTIVTYVQYLKLKLLKSLFHPDKLADIHTLIQGPKLRINILSSDEITSEFFRDYGKEVLNKTGSTSEIKFKENPKHDDHFGFYKTGLVIYTSLKHSKTIRQFIRNNFDFIMDVTFGTEILLPLLPSHITHCDIQLKDCSLDIAYFSAFYSLNPNILKSKNQLIALLPTSGLKKWYSLLLSTTNLEKELITIYEDLLRRLKEIRFDRWYKIINDLLTANIPEITDRLLNDIKEQQASLREVLLPHPQIDEQNIAIINYLTEKLNKDLTRRYIDNDYSLKENLLGFSTLYQIEQAFKIKGRDHMEFKQRIDLLTTIGLVETVPYKGPGSKKDSKQYRAAITHSYIRNKVHQQAIGNYISTLKMDDLS